MRLLRISGLVACAVVVAGCGFWQKPQPSSSVRPVKIEWLGNQCFRISSSIGMSILTNPYAAGTGGRTLPSPLKPDIILISHERPDANNIDATDNQPTIFRGSIGLGVNNSSGIRIRGVPSFRNPGRETIEGMNIIYAWTMDGIRFCFLGSLENALTPEQVSQLQTIDVLFVPVGGSLSAADRAQVLSQIRPRVVIPMGRGAGGWTTGHVHSVPGRSLELTRESLPLQMTTILFGS